MYKGFQLELIEEDFYSDKVFNTFYEIGKTYTSVQENNIKKTIDSYLFSNGTLNGSNMQENWFPQIKADIFISHSHKDEKLALALAGWLKETFGLTAFIDLCVWGYSNNLLKLIDDVYCRNINRNSYDYDKRNYSTSHVHMMLSVALTQMIDNTECLFFLNTPNSITPDDTIIKKTKSPWVYSEIAMSRLIRKKELKEYRDVVLMESQRAFAEGGTLDVRYDLPTEHLTEIDAEILESWENSWCLLNSPKHEYLQHPKKIRVYALDKLYELTK